MADKLKARHTFYGREGKIDKGQTFIPSSKERGEELVRLGHAEPDQEGKGSSQKKKPSHANKSTKPSENK